MTIEYIRYNVAEEQRHAFVEAYKSAAQELNESEFCTAYELCECEEEDGQFILRIEWTSTNDHINGFRKSQVFPSFFAKVKPYFDNILEMRHYKLTDIVRMK